MRRGLVCLLVGACAVLGDSGDKAEVFFFGFVPGAGPSFEKSLDRLLRERLSAVPEIALAGRSETATLKRRMDQSDFGGSSKAVVDALTEYTEEDAMVVWARVAHFAIEAERHMLFDARAHGVAAVTFHIYHPRTRKYLFIGDVDCGAFVPKPAVWFRDARVATHITAADRSNLLDLLMADASNKGSELVRAIVRHHFSAKNRGLAPGGPAAPGVAAPVMVDDGPSLEDLFDIPMSEPARIDSAGERIPPGTPSRPETSLPALTPEEIVGGAETGDSAPAEEFPAGPEETGENAPSLDGAETPPEQ